MRRTNYNAVPDKGALTFEVSVTATVVASNEAGADPGVGALCMSANALSLGINARVKGA